MKRGRKSPSDMAVVASITDARPAPTDDLNLEQCEEWRAVVRRLPQDWFPRETHSMLAAYCKHVSAHRFLSRQIDSFQDDWLSTEEGVKRYAALTAMREREGRAMFAAARALRITKASQTRPETAYRTIQGVSFTGKRPWDTDFLDAVEDDAESGAD